MIGAPFDFYDAMSLSHNSLQPYSVKGSANLEAAVERRYLYTSIYSRFKFGLPKSWDLNFFRALLFMWGSGCVIYTKEFGWVFQPYGVSKINYQYNPKEVVVYNSFFRKEKFGLIGINAEIVKVMDDYFGLDDIVRKYATMLAQIDKSININLMNSNVSLVIEAANKKQADELKIAYSEATTGKPYVAINKELLEGEQLHPLITNVKNNYIVNDLLSARRTLMNEFLTKIGIRNTNFEKRAQMNSEEITRNDDEVKSIISVIFDNIKSGFDRVNRISDLNLTVELVEEEVKEYGAVDSMGNVSVRT